MYTRNVMQAYSNYHGERESDDYVRMNECWKDFIGESRSPSLCMEIMIFQLESNSVRTDAAHASEMMSWNTW